MKTYTYEYFWFYLAQIFVEREIFNIKVVEKIKTHILGSVTFYKNRSLYEMTGEKIW